MYKEILELEKLYSNTPMEYFKENLFVIRSKKYEQYKENCKRMGIKIGKYRMFEILDFGLHKEKSIVNSAHTYKISFLDIIKICNLLNIPMDKLAEKPMKRDKREYSGNDKWTEELRKEFIRDCESNIGLDEIADKYQISVNSVLRYHQAFKLNKTTHGKIRITAE